VGPRAGRDRCGKSRLHKDSIPETSSYLPVAIPTHLPDPRPTSKPSINYISDSFFLRPPLSAAPHVPPNTSDIRLSGQHVSESSVIIPDIPPLPTCTTL